MRLDSEENMCLDSWISSASMVGMSAFTLYLDYRLELFFSWNLAKNYLFNFLQADPRVLTSTSFSTNDILEEKKTTNKAIKTFTTPAANGTSLERRTSKFPQAHWDLDRKPGGRRGPRISQNCCTVELLHKETASSWLLTPGCKIAEELERVRQLEEHHGKYTCMNFLPCAQWVVSWWTMITKSIDYPKANVVALHQSDQRDYLK